MKALFICLIILASFFQGCEKKAEVKKIKVREGEIAYYTRGQGEPLVLIMGFRGTMALWDPALLNALEKNFTLILFDNRGVGLSTDEGSEELTISRMADDTADLIKALGYPKAHVMGWSMGSRIAMDLAMRHADLVDHLILCSPNPGGKHAAKRVTNAYQKLTAKKMSPEEGLSLIFPDNAQGKAASEALVSRLRKAIIAGSTPNDLDISTQTILHQVSALSLWEKNENIYPALKDIRMPTLVAGGLADVLDSPENVRTIACQIPYAWSAYFSNAGHYFTSQYHHNFSELVLLFINSTQ